MFGPPRSIHPGYRNESGSGQILDSKIYIGIIKDNADVQRMGRLSVYIPEMGGSPTDPTRWYTVSYASPFAGVTPPSGLGKDSNKDVDSQQSYGWWMIPPDLENHVLVTFINGEPSRGFWFACVYAQNMNHMVPGIAANSVIGADKTVLEPVVEYNKRASDQPPPDPPRPRFSTLADAIQTQGLSDDFERGPTSASARREAPSRVFGFKTPGGHQIYADDVNGRYIRLRTMQGAQVLIHNDNGYVYINSKDGKSWVEISDEGISMYSAKPVSVRTEDDLNFCVDGDFNVDVAGSMNVKVGQNATSKVGGDDNRTIVGKSAESIGGDQHTTVTGTRFVNVSGSDNLTVGQNIIGLAGGDWDRTAANIRDNAGVDPAQAVAATAPQTAKRDDLKSTGEAQQLETVVGVLPTHEPWAGHPKNVAKLSSTAKITPEAGSGGTTAVQRGDGSIVNVPNKAPRKGAGRANAKKPNDVIGSPHPGDQPGFWAGVGYDANGNPIWEFKGPITDEQKAPSQLTISDYGAHFIQKTEVFTPNLYNDVGHPAIGYGHDLTPEEIRTGTIRIGDQVVNVSDGLTKDQADALSKQDFAKYESVVQQNVKVPLTQSQYDALVSFTYNVGPGAFQNSNLLTQLNSGNYSAVPEELSKWNKATVNGQKVELSALTKRRSDEIALWSAGAPSNSTGA